MRKKIFQIIKEIEEILINNRLDIEFILVNNNLREF